LTLFSKFFSSFPHGTCSLSVFRLIFSLGWSSPPRKCCSSIEPHYKALGCIPKQPDSWRGNDAVRSNLNALLSEHVVCCGRDLKKPTLYLRTKPALSCGTITLDGPPFQGSWVSRPGHDLPPTLPPKATICIPPLNLGKRAISNVGFSRFARRYSGNPRWFLFLR